MLNYPHNDDLKASILIVGDSHIGKKSLQNRLCSFRFTNQTYKVGTGNYDFSIKVFEVDGKRIRLKIRSVVIYNYQYQAITTACYRQADGIILGCAVNDRESFQNIEKWMKQIKDHANEEVYIILVGNKCDIPDRCVDYEEGKKLADNYGIKFFETSAKDISKGDVNEPFRALAKEIYERSECKNNGTKPRQGDNNGQTVKLEDGGELRTGKNECCCQ